MRQAGVLAAAGLYALDHHVDRLAEDHERAARLAKGLAEIDGVTVLAQNTNMIFAEIPGAGPKLSAALATDGVRVRADWRDTRLVTHLGLDDDDIDAAVEAFARHVN